MLTDFIEISDRDFFFSKQQKLHCSSIVQLFFYSWKYFRRGNKEDCFPFWFYTDCFPHDGQFIPSEYCRTVYLISYVEQISSSS